LKTRSWKDGLSHYGETDLLIAGYIALLMSVIGTMCLLVAAACAGRLRERSVQPDSRATGVTILKPLHGSEPALTQNLASFLTQDYSGQVQMICGVQHPGDPAIAIVNTLKSAHPGADIMLVIDETSHGTNAKVSNLINMIAQAKYPALVISDSDMAAPRHYLSMLLGELDAPGIGAVTCLYRGRGDAGVWSRLAAMGISYHFLPSILLGTAFGLATPCMGSTIALRTEMLERIGGLETFADLLADDYAIGAAIRALGLKVTLSSVVLDHGCTETGLRAVVRQELRWNATILGIDRWGYVGSVILHPLPLALFGAALCGFTITAIAITTAALAARLIIAFRIGPSRLSLLVWTPIRDILSFALFIDSFFVRSVDWRSARFRVVEGGRLSAKQDF
jgi:ceramide glucosyltransferase